MPRRSRATVTVARKAPLQERSRRTREDLLDGATRVLGEVGAVKFTTNRVAEVTGVSVGSLYQYYPNKAALLVELHQRDAERVWTQIEAVLDDSSLSGRARLEQAIGACMQAQAAADQHHRALREARDPDTRTQELTDVEQRACVRLEAFIRATSRSTHDPAFAARFCLDVVQGLLERVASGGRSGELVAITHATATMLADYLRL